MPERPLLALPRPATGTPRSRNSPREKVKPIAPDRQAIRLGPKFARLEQALPDPATLAELRDDPSAIVPERALVFEVASDMVDFYRAVRGVPGLEFLGEDEGDAPSDDFVVMEKAVAKPDKRVPRRFYFTIPDEAALRELVSLWKRYQAGQELGLGRAEWKKVFGHLADLRPWGPKDRLTQDALDDWTFRLENAPEEPIQFEIEFWYRDNDAQRTIAEASFFQEVQRLHGQVIDRSTIDQIRYHAALVRVPSAAIQYLLAHPEAGMATTDSVMVLRPQAIVAGPVDANLEEAPPVGPDQNLTNLPEPVAALFDGLPMAQHSKLATRLIIDDPDDFAASYGNAREQRHGTGMASLILHGDLNDPNPPPPLAHRLYVRPVLFPQQADIHGQRNELMPPDRLGIDLMWRAFRRMCEGDGTEPPTAPTVKIVNLSLGDANRRFSGVMSPWARLIDHVSWRYGLLVLVSAGNIPDAIPLPNVAAWADVENASSADREKQMLRALIAQRATRKILSPAESVNSLTIGAGHSDFVLPNGLGVMAVDPFQSSSLPNASSGLGLGFHRGVKPELLFPGGVEQLRSNSTGAPIHIRPVDNPGARFGIGVASPGPAGQTDRKVNMIGTSVATALATHGALRILDALNSLPDDPSHPEIDGAYHSVILKALLIHSAKWDLPSCEALSSVLSENGSLHWEHEREEIARFMGFGCADVKTAVECTEKRATLVGSNSIHADETDVYKIPLPIELQGVAGFRAVTVTLAWLTPVTLAHRMYRMAKLVGEPGGDKEFSLAVKNAKSQPSHNAVGRGSVFHRRWEGADAAAFVDDGYLLLNVTCTAAAGQLDEAIPYGIAVTLEVGSDITVQIYERIQERLRQAVPIAT